MADDGITLQRDQSAALEVGELLSAIRDLRSVYERLDRIRAKMKRRFDDAGGVTNIDWSHVQALWGIPAGADSTGPGSNGAIVFTMVDGAVLSMEGAVQTDAARQLTERVG